MHDMTKHDAVVHHAPTSFISKHVFSLDHKVIGKQYYGMALLAAFVGMGLSWLMRLHLGWTNAAIPGLHLLTKNGAPGDVMTPEFYLQLMTMHATIMVFFVLTTAPFAAFGNYFLPPGRRRGHAVSAFQHDVVLGHVRRLPGFGVFIFCGHGADSRRLDPVRPVECDRRSRRSRRRHRRGSLGAFDCHLLRWSTAWLAEFHHHHTGYADARHEFVAAAAQRLGLVHYVVHGPYG